MQTDQAIISEIMKIQDSTALDYNLSVDQKTIPLQSATISRSSIPVNKPTKRGGVYFSDTSAFTIKCITDDISIVPLLSKVMLGPNTEFGILKLQTKLPSGTQAILFANLTNSMQSSSKLELNLVVI